MYNVAMQWQWHVAMWHFKFIVHSSGMCHFNNMHNNSAVGPTLVTEVADKPYLCKWRILVNVAIHEMMHATGMSHEHQRF